MKHYDLTGKIFGKLTALQFHSRSPEGNAIWECKCECGSVTLKRACHLHTGNTVSCGCHRRAKHVTHGLSNLPEYSIWTGIITRCSNKNRHSYKDYAGRGIKMCERWRHSFPNFLADVGRRPDPSLTLDRIDNDGDYEPGNVRWATKKEQRANQRPRTREPFKRLKRKRLLSVALTIDGHLKRMARVPDNLKRDVERLIEMLSMPLDLIGPQGSDEDNQP